MRIFRLALLTPLVLAACSASSGSIPHYNDAAGVERAAASLSPWEDGSPDRSNDGQTPGEVNSDRQIFRRWFQRYRVNETVHQHERDYEPFPVPGGLAAAIDEQRNFERDRKKAYDAAQPARDAEKELGKRRSIAVMHGIAPCSSLCDWETVDRYIYDPQVNQLYDAEVANER